ncbi:hypothetical protein M885DRAFT_50236 [Pelagophyceae sp. CCMP2097]|nr:hypothetical protein M885DRAFT_50236 [Pelagophyceae sp. CCMP2097]
MVRTPLAQRTEAHRARRSRQLTAAAQPALSSDYGDGDYDDDCGDDDDDSGGLCIICMAAPKAVAFVPCGHVCACLVCFRKFAGAGITNCPICREPIAGSTPLEPRSAA